MPSLGIVEILLILACCSLPFVFLAGAGLIFALIKLGVIGSYWLKGESPPQEGGDYTLDQSQEVSKK